MTPDLGHIMNYLTQGIVCLSTAAILLDLQEMAGAFALGGGMFIVLYAVCGAGKKYRGELYE